MGKPQDTCMEQDNAPYKVLWPHTKQ